MLIKDKNNLRFYSFPNNKNYKIYYKKGETNNENKKSRK